MENIKLDTKGMDCPLPLMELKKALGEAEYGQIIEVEFTCPDAVVNLPSYCEEHNHKVLEFDKQNNKALYSSETITLPFQTFNPSNSYT